MSNPSSAENAFRMETEQRGDTVILRLYGSANMDISNELQDHLCELIASGIHRLVLDLTRLDFISSVGLGAVIAAHLRSRHYQCHVCLAGPQSRINELLDVTRLNRLLLVFPTLEQALQG